MTRIEGEIVINRPVDEVFDFVADARNEPLYNPRMLRAEKLTPGPIGLGTRFRDEIKSMGRPAEITIEIIGYERPRRLTDSIHLSTMDIRGGLTFDPVPAGTRMRWSWELMPRGVFRLMSPMVARIGRRQELRIWADLKRSWKRKQRPPQPLARDLGLWHTGGDRSCPLWTAGGSCGADPARTRAGARWWSQKVRAARLCRRRSTR